MSSSACYSWQTGAGPADATDARESGSLDVTAEVMVDVTIGPVEAEAAPTTDAAADAPRADAGPDAVSGDATASTCLTLADQADAARVSAQACSPTTFGQCTTFVADRCGCQHFVAEPSTAAAEAYEAAVLAQKAANCGPACLLCGIDEPYGLCLSASTGSAVATACTP